MKKHRTYLKFISYILIQTFIALDFCWAGPLSVSAGESTLAPTIEINRVELQGIFDLLEINTKEIDEIDDELIEFEQDNKSEVITDEKNSSGSLGGIVQGEVNTSNSSSSAGNIKGNGPQFIPLPPPEYALPEQIVHSFKTFFLNYPNDDEKTQLELFEEYREKTHTVLDSSQGDKAFTSKDSKVIMQTLVKGELAERLFNLGLFVIARQTNQVKDQEPNEKKLLDFDTLGGRNMVIVFYDSFFKSDIHVRISALNQLIQSLEGQSKKSKPDDETIDYKNYNGGDATGLLSDFMKDTGLDIEDIKFKKIIDKIVLENSTHFEKVVWVKMEPLDSNDFNDKNQGVRGAFRVTANNGIQNAVDLAVSALALQRPKDEIIKMMLNIMGIAQNKITPALIQILHNTVNLLEQKEVVSLKDVYTFSTRLTIEMINLGLTVFDQHPIERKKLGIRTHLVKKMRQLYEEDPREFTIWLKYHIVLHEEGHTLPMRIQAHYLQWIVFKTKEIALEVFRFLLLGNYPGILLDKLKLNPLQDKNEYRTLMDLISQSKYLYGYDPNGREFHNILWSEAMPHYYAYLKLQEMNKEDDELIIKSFALNTHYAFEFYPPRNLELVLDDSIEGLYPFLTVDQASRVKNQVLGLQARARIREEMSSGTRTFAAAPFTLLAANTSQTVFSSTDIVSNVDFSWGSVNDWLIIGSIITVFFLFKALWNRLPWGKTPEQRAIQLMKNPEKLRSFFEKSQPQNKIIIMNTLLNKFVDETQKRLMSPNYFEDILLAGLDSGQPIKVRKAAVDAIIKFSGAVDVRQSFLNSIEKYTNDDVEFVAKGITKTLEQEGLRYSEITGTFKIDSKFIDEKIKSKRSLQNANSQQTTTETKPRKRLSLEKMLSFFRRRTTEEETTRQVNIAMRQGKTTGLVKFFNQASMSEKNRIINAAVKHIMANQSELNLELFEMFFYGILRENPQHVIGNIQNKVTKNIPVKGNEQVKIAEIVAMNNIALPALTFYNQQSYEKIDTNEIMLDLSKVIVDLAISGSLHKEEAFISAIANNEKLSRLDIQASRLYRLVIGQIAKSSYVTEVLIAKLIKKELNKIDSRVDAAQVTTELMPYLIANLSGLSGLIQDRSFITTVFAFSPTLRKSSIERKVAQEFFATIYKTLINDIALRLAFRDSFLNIKGEIEKLDLTLNAEKTAEILLPVMVRTALSSRAENEYEKIAQNAEYRKFYSELEASTEKLRLASISGLELFSEVGAGTSRLILYLKEYLARAGTGISMDLEKRKIEAVIRNLSPKQNMDSQKKADTENPLLNSPKIVIDKFKFKNLFSKVNLINSAI